MENVAGVRLRGRRDEDVTSEIGSDCSSPSEVIWDKSNKTSIGVAYLSWGPRHKHLAITGSHRGSASV